MIYNNIEFRSYDSMYYVSAYGDVYSTYKKGLLKHSIDIDGYHRVDIHGEHMKIHRLVYEVWNGYIPEKMQINHYDDDKNNNYYKNLYLGTQKDNIKDCVRNGHRVGNIKQISVYDKKVLKILNFKSIKEFLNYTGHNISNGSLSHVIDKKWFKERFVIVEEKSVTTIENYKSIRA